MKLTLETLELASMALNAKVVEHEQYPMWSAGSALKARFLTALNEVNEEIAERNND